MVAATWTVYVVLDAYLAAINSDGSLVSDPIVLQHFIDGTIMAGVTLMAALIVWSIWIALVVRNVPALTARWAPNGWLSALLAAWIPFINLRRPHSVVRGVLGTLAVGRPLPILVALAWWVSVLAAYVVPSVAIWFGRSDDRASFSAIVSIQDVLMVVALFFAVAVVVIVEWEQHGALVRRADAVFGEAPAAA
jgi:hypothetical protein